MTSETDETNEYRSLAPAVTVEQTPGEFCPVFGWMQDPSLQFNEEMRCLLGKRLQMAAMVITGAFAAFFVRNLLHPDLIRMLGVQFSVTHAVVTLFTATVFGVLTFRPCMPIGKLRLLEFFLFGVPAAFFVWMQYSFVCNCSGDEIKEIALLFPYRTVLPWLALIFVYGVFIPKTWQRASVVIGLMAVMPFAGSYAAGLQHPAVQRVLSEGGYSFMLLWMGIGAVTSIYGSHRFRRLRREAFEAKNVGVYTLLKKLGSGGMGDVFLAEHHLLKRRCAIKLIKPEKADDPKAIARFESEVQATALLTHQNTIEIYDYGHTEDGTFYYVMEFLPGMSLQEIVDGYGPLPAERVVHYLRQVCSALKESHSVGLIHRDIKPGNIFAAERGGVYDIAKLLDFGLVKTIDLENESIKHTLDGVVVGSPLFSAPELALGGVLDARSDIYSLGTTAYFLLTGKPVFAGENPIKVIFAHANEAPPEISTIDEGIPTDLVAVVMKCLEKKPEDRFGSVEELDSALAECDLPEQWTQRQAAAWWTQTTEIASSDQKLESETLEMTTAMNVEK
ncbi:MAG: serine/threonine protein kinase [Planctomycetes bacterium]|nr:serine/threonine protein kinase [Planctomycetota bacterium]